MIIDVDIGNSRVKWRSFSAPEEIAVFPADGVASEALPKAWFALSASDRMRVSSVLAPEKTAHFIERVQRSCGVTPQVAVVQKQFAGLVIAYRDPSRLGVDRWLAMLAARAKFPQHNCVICSGGTALTVDLLRADGRHLGGYIAPGLKASRRALWQNTDAVSIADAALVERQRPGTTTLECVEAGFTAMYCGFFAAIITPVRESFADVLWIFTGGDADFLQRAWQCTQSGRQQADLCSTWCSIILPGLVLDGLAEALP